MKTLPVIGSIALLIVSVQAQTPAPAPASAPLPATAQGPSPATKADEGSSKGRRLVYARPKASATGTRVDGDGGSRSGGVKLPSLYVLAPNHTGLTTHAQPSLFWYQGGPAATRFVLTVVEPGKPKPVLQVSADASDRPGIHRLPLSKYNINLAQGTLYKWSVALVPDAANRSQDVIASGTIQRTEPDAQFTSALASADGAGKAALYAGQGYWYDALEVVANEIDGAPKDKALRLQRANLLEQVGLKDAAEAERK